MARMGFDTPNYAPDGKDYDTTHIGGYGTRTNGERDKNGTLIVTGSGRQDTVDRYRGLGDAAAARQAYQVNFEQAKADEAQGLRSRGQQERAVDMMRGAAYGGAPSRAAIQGQQAAGQSLEATMGASAGARSMGGMAAQMQAQRGQGAMQQQAVGQLAGMRANEMNDARSAYGAGAGAIRGGDMAQQSLAQQRAEAQGQSEMDQRGRNDALQAGYEGMGFDVNEFELNRNLQQKEIFAKRFDTASKKQERDAAGNDRMFGAFMSSMGGATAAASGGGDDLSDERTKERVVPLVNEADAGVEQRWDREVVPAAAIPSGASLSAPTPKYSSMGAAAAARPAAPHASPAAPKQAQPRKLSDAELKKLGEEMLASQGAKTKASLDAGPAIRDKGEPMGDALADGLKPFEYEYRPEHRGSELQAAGEKNVGPMAQDMASNPVTGTAVKRGSDGLLYIDQPKALKLSLGGIGYLAAKQREQEAEIARLKGRG